MSAAYDDFLMVRLPRTQFGYEHSSRSGACACALRMALSRESADVRFYTSRAGKSQMVTTGRNRPGAVIQSSALGPHRRLCSPQPSGVRNVRISRRSKTRLGPPARVRSRGSPLCSGHHASSKRLIQPRTLERACLSQFGKCFRFQ